MNDLRDEIERLLVAIKRQGVSFAFKLATGDGVTYKRGNRWFVIRLNAVGGQSMGGGKG